MYYFIISLLVLLIILISCLFFVHKNITNQDIQSDWLENEDTDKFQIDEIPYNSHITGLKAKFKILNSLNISYKNILDGYKYISIQSNEKKDIVPAAEWILDNLYIIQKEYNSIKKVLTKGRYNNLPIVHSGGMKGYPRIYYIALKLVNELDSKINKKNVENFIENYQENILLCSREIWIMPIMIKIALIQNISKIITKIVHAQKERNSGEEVADKLITYLDREEEIKDIFSKKFSFSIYFTEKLTRTLKDNVVDNMEIYNWIDKNLEMKENNIKSVINSEHKKQAFYKLIMGNSFTSIRKVMELNWKQSFEKLSSLEKILMKDPSGVYNNMDCKSKDHYRNAIEKIAIHMRVGETFVANKAIECAKENISNMEKPYLHHVGYYLIDRGVDCLKKKMELKDRKVFKIKPKNFKSRAKWYISSVVFVTLVLSVCIDLTILRDDIYASYFKYIIGFLAIVVPVSQIVISIINWSVNHLSKPSIIPKIEIKKDIPKEYSTIVVIPTLLNNKKRVTELIDDLEVYYLANKSKNIFFAILGDFKDSKYEHEKKDEEIIQCGLDNIKTLNDKYSEDEDIFYFFNRYRQFNEKENIWLGWERKRGKLVEFNNLIRGDKNTSYNTVSGDISKLYDVKYVITLDADTKLPILAAKELIGAMAHPLNVPYVSKNNKSILRGHGLMQPRISVGVEQGNKTLFSKIFSGETGIDIYTTAVSDVYQDLFDEGIFTGKGIYDVDVFNYMLKDEIPENTVLSHDLLEGSYLRAGLLTDVELIDGYPAYYNSSTKRLHRWVRGDWQLIKWLFKKTPINGLSKWKIFDNMRRSFLSPSIIILIVLALTFLGNSDKWVTIAILSVLSPILFNVSDVIVMPSRGINLTGKIKNWGMGIEQFVLIFSFLPYQCYVMLDAIIRTLYRVFISKKNCLQWQTAEDAEVKSGKNLKSYVLTMMPGSLIAIIIQILAFRVSNYIGFLAMPSCIIWFISPYVAYIISKDIVFFDYDLNDYEKKILRRLSIKTWSYFDDFVTEENNWLVPDNYQIDPPNGIAERTSPTNIGMSITSLICAFDLGYIDILECINRMKNIINSVKELEKYQGHLLNWYDIKTKEPLYPRYVSTVDSGNLVGYLWVTLETLDEYLNSNIVSHKMIEGLCDLIDLCNKELNENKIDINYNESLYELNKNNKDIINFQSVITKIQYRIKKISKYIDIDTTYWNKKLYKVVDMYLNHIDKLFPWMKLINNKKFINLLNFNVDDINRIDIFTRLKDIFNNKGVVSAINELDKVSDEIFRLNKNEYMNKLYNSINDSKKQLYSLYSKIINVKKDIENICNDTNFNILFNKDNGLFCIGYDTDREKRDNCFYDLLASESRQASFIAIAKGDIDKSHWFKLGRGLTFINGRKGLISWSGTMFEYLMPLLIMKKYPNTLLYETYKFIVNSQRQYGIKKHIPWGISESAFYNFDVNLNYQYKAFGIPGAGLKRGLGNELVISPYATVMALQVNKKDALNNIKDLIKCGVEGRYGLYESIDYTKERLPKGKSKAIVKSFMVHHEGMSLMSFDNVLDNNIFQQRFHKKSEVKATELLLQEKVPKDIVYSKVEKNESNFRLDYDKSMIQRTYEAISEYPKVNLLSNGSYSIMITNSGSSYSKKDDTMLYRWKEDSTNDNTGMFFYIKNLNSNEYWSNTYQPCKYAGEDYKAIFSLDKAEFKRKDGNIVTTTEVTVSQEDNSEVRKLKIHNNSNSSRTIEVTSYCEVTLANYDADVVHPAFGNLFINTEFVEEPMCIIGNRRKRAKDQKENWIMQTVISDTKIIGNVQYETDRSKFIGRGNELYNPKVMENNEPLTNSVGAVLDPIISLRIRVKILPKSTCKIAYCTAIGECKDEVIALAKKYRDFKNISRTFELTATENALQIRYLGIKSTMANLYQIMASNIIFLNPSFRKRQEYIKKINKGQSALWNYGISGDFPIILFIIKEEKNIDLLNKLLKAHEYWGLKGVKTDFIILNYEESSYIQNLHESLNQIIDSSHLRDRRNLPGGIFVYNKATMNEEDRKFIIAIARLVIISDKGSLKSQIDNKHEAKFEFFKSKNVEYKDNCKEIIKPKLKYFNDLGGFDTENNRYVIVLDKNKNTPAPWINVISNKNFGFHISESGVAYTWYKNSRENKITTWSNDPIKDSEAEALYLRDDVSYDTWSITPKPIRDDKRYLIEHGFGYSKFKHNAYGIEGEYTTFASKNHSVKFGMVKLKNCSNISRKLSITYYSQLVLGVIPSKSAQYITTYFNEKDEYMYAKNPYNNKFGKYIAYMKIIGGKDINYTGDRKEFLGREGTINSPKGLKLKSLTGNVGSGLDPCIAINSSIKIEPDEEKYLCIVFGEDEDIDEVNKSIQTYNSLQIIREELQHVKDYWKEMLGNIQIKTPDTTMDLMVNGWLMYQVISCRFWARSAFYQSGGAFGFRDQLQDSIAISYIYPEYTREHILYSASRQFIEGDVQHWWHPIVDSGIRTRFSDDLLWLPYVTIAYIKNTGDYTILDEEVTYLEDEPLKEGEDERYKISSKSNIKGSIYEHCIKSIDERLKFGEHNIPLMGSGDWNDGMSTVGNKGKGESVWVAWFLYTILDDFIKICYEKKDKDNAEKYSQIKKFIQENLEENAWDGNWYRRAYFDDGKPLGSSENEECQIDSLSQSWAVISGAAKKTRAKEAMLSAEKYLVEYDKGLVKLLTPAFNKSSLEPGYIKGYVPGVRENGGQYTHAAIWYVLALAKMGFTDKAWKIFNMINPINHTRSFLDCERYKVEPYVISADVYAVDPHVGRGGWSWYTGAAGWMYTTAVSGILGLTLQGEKGFSIEPKVPKSWDKYSIRYKRNKCVYEIYIVKGKENKITLDGKEIRNGIIPFLDEDTHYVEITII